MPLALVAVKNFKLNSIVTLLYLMRYEMNKIKVLGLALALGVSSLSLHASDFGYSFVQLGFGITDDENSTSNGEYSGVTGSFQTQNGVLVLFESTRFEESGQYDFDFTAIGAGIYTATGSQTDLYGGLQLVNADLGAENDESGFRVSIGIRTALTSHIELDGSVKHEDVYDNDSDTGYGLALRYYATPNVAAGVHYDSTDINGLGIESIYGSIRFIF